MAHESILIIDDSPLNLKLARVLLQSEGYVIRTASEGNEALSILNTFRPKLVLMDIQLPGIDGLEVTRRIKANPDTQSIIVIALTASAMKGDEGKVLSAGCDGYITKPFESRKLLLRGHGTGCASAPDRQTEERKIPDCFRFRPRLLDAGAGDTPRLTSSKKSLAARLG